MQYLWYHFPRSPSHSRASSLPSIIGLQQRSQVQDLAFFGILHCCTVCSQTPIIFTQWSGSLKRYAGLEDVHKRRKCSHRVTVTKAVRRAGRCSQTPIMFTQWSGSLNRYAGLEDVHKRRKCSRGRMGHLKRYAGLEDVHKRRKCSHRVTVTKAVRKSGRCSHSGADH